MDLDNENCVEEIVDSTPNTKHLRQPALLETDSDLEQEIKLAQLKKKKSKAKRKAKIERLEREKKKGFVSEKPIYNKDYIHRLAFKKSKHVRNPDVYKSALQRALVTFLTQVDNVFCQKLITYTIKKDKVLYAINYIADTVQLKWRKEDKEITSISDRLYSYKRLCEFLQERILPVHMRQVEITVKCHKMSQQSNQLVQKLKVALNEIKDQAVSKYTDGKRWNLLFTAINIGLRNAPVRLNKLMCTH